MKKGPSIKKRISQYQYIVINSNRWFSAVSDYSLQLAIYLNKQKKVLYCADKNHTAMEEKCKINRLDFLHLPLIHSRLFNFLVCLYNLLIILRKQKSLKYFFVFEGREHVLLVILKILCPFLWTNIKLVRIRGQTQSLSKNIFSYLIYRFLTDKIVFTAKVIKNRVPFLLPNEKMCVCYYGKNTQFPKNYIQFYHLKRFNYNFNFSDNILTFLNLGRFDPVKGHDYLLEAFLKADFKDTSTQLICIGTRESVSAKNLYEKYKFFENFSERIENDGLYVLSTSRNLKKIIMLEFYFSDALLFMKNSSFGVIPSLDSETICRVGVEFLQAGIPVLYSDAGALSEIFSASPEYRFKAGNSKELVDKLELARKVFIDSQVYLDEKNKAHKIWVERFQGDIYQDIMLPG